VLLLGLRASAQTASVSIICALGTTTLLARNGGFTGVCPFNFIAPLILFDELLVVDKDGIRKMC
jgi:hypothetical protein